MKNGSFERYSITNTLFITQTNTKKFSIFIP